MNDDVTQPMAEPVEPKPADYGLSDGDLSRKTPRDILLSEELATVITVVGTALAIWYFGWWGIAVACAGLGALYLLRRIIEATVMGELDAARARFNDDSEAYVHQRRAYDAQFDD